MDVGDSAFCFQVSFALGTTMHPILWWILKLVSEPCKVGVYRYVDHEEHIMNRQTKLNDEEINVGGNSQVFNMAVGQLQKGGKFVPWLPGLIWPSWNDSNPRS